MTQNKKYETLNSFKEMEVLIKEHFKRNGEQVPSIAEIRVYARYIVSKRLREHNSNTHQTPPQHAVYLLYLFIPRNNREAILGDLEEDFHEVHEKFGLRKAQFQYWVQVLRSLGPIIKACIKAWLVKLIMTSIKKFRATS